MSQIPTYLTALADLCDKHGTHAKGMGPELRLLAGLPWEGVNYFAETDAYREQRAEEMKTGVLKETMPGPERRITTPADVARGFLNCARGIETCSTVEDIDFLGVNEGDSDRAAACAELAVLSARLYMQPCDHPDYMGAVFAHDGTTEGARACWDFIANGPLTPEQAAPIFKTLGMRTFVEFVAFAQKTADVYRRELEAMK